MKKQTNYSQLKEQEKYPERKNKETNFSSIPDPKFKKKVTKILKELRKTIDRKTDHSKKELKIIKRSQSKLDN